MKIGQIAPLLGVVLFACSRDSLTSSPIVETQAATGGISGHICDRDLGQWITGATVTADTDATAVATTDADGAFTLNGLPPGPVTLTITSDSYNSTRNGFVTAGE